MSIRRMTLGSGFRYLMSSVARMDEAGPAANLTAYYAAAGTPTGRFLGAGLAALNNGEGVEVGSVVTEEALWRMLGMLQDPLTGEFLGRPPAAPRTSYIDRTGQLRPAPKTVAGFDLTFSAPKSVSVAWALADDVTRNRIHAAHQRALQFVIRYAEQRVIETRVGAGGCVSDPIKGVVAAAFDHWDSRSGDPQLHTHVVVLNRVQSGVDGKWRTLDSKGLYRSAVTLSELYNGVLADQLTAELGWDWVPQQRRRSAEPKWEVGGIEAELRDEFSQRTSALDATKDDLVEDFVASHGRQPTSVEVLKMRQEATIATRPDKHIKPLRELIDGWRTRAAQFVGDDPQCWVADLARNASATRLVTDLSLEMLEGNAAETLEKVAAKRSTFTRANVLAEVLRGLHGVRFAAPADRIRAAEQAASKALKGAVMLTPPEIGLVPDGFRRTDGTSRFRARHSEIYSTQALLDAEARLLAAAGDLEGPRANGVPAPTPSPTIDADAAASRDVALSDEQAAAVAAVTESGRRVDVLVGAAGTGKSTTMAAVRAAWEARHGPGSVVGLAPSAAAAEVLADALGVPTENTAKWIAENRKAPERRADLERYAAALFRAHPSLQTRRLTAAADACQAESRRWSLRKGQLIIVDEASMAATHDLDYLTAAAVEADAKILLVGDWAQLSPVQAGGAFKLLVDARTDTAQLLDVHRFHHAWEREASLRLRTGDARAVQAYLRNDRVVAADRESLLDQIFTAWQTDTDAGRSSLMLAADRDTVTDLNTRARNHRVAAGQVSPDGVKLGDGTVIGAGDLIVTRYNQRDLDDGRRWVKNGDEWTVQAVHDDGSVDVRRPHGRRTIRLRPEYVTDHAELGYATTAHLAQGRTVDTAHAYVAPTTVREPLYVMASRGRDWNMLYVDVAHDPDVATAHHDLPEQDPAEVLRAILATSGADISATQTRHQEQRNADSPARIAAQGAVIQRRLTPVWVRDTGIGLDR